MCLRRSERKVCKQREVLNFICVIFAPYSNALELIDILVHSILYFHSTLNKILVSACVRAGNTAEKSFLSFLIFTPFRVRYSNFDIK